MSMKSPAVRRDRTASEVTGPRLSAPAAVILGGLLAACLASAPSVAFATSLKGKPFLLDPEYAAIEPQYGVLFNYEAGFAATFAAGVGGASAPNELSFKTFTKSGKTDVKKTLVAKGTLGPWDEVLIGGAGGLYLGDDRALIGFLDKGYFNNDKAVGGLFGRIAKNGKIQGEKRALDNSKKDRTEFGSIIPLSDGRGLAYWQTYDEVAAEYTAGGRIIGSDGAPEGKAVDLTRSKGALQDVVAFGSNFVTLQRNDRNYPLQTLFAQIYDAKGAKIGKEGVLTKATDSGLNKYPKILPLSDKRFVFLRSVPAGDANAMRLHGQVYNENWETVGADKVLVEKMADGFYTATSLPGGGVLVASVEGEENGTETGRIEVRRFNQKLKQAGPTAKSGQLKYKTFLTQLLALKNGDAVLSYTPENGKLTAQIIKP